MANFQEHILRKQAAASLASGNLAQAESTCRQILSRRKNDLTALQVMGVIAFERGQFADAASYLRKCLTQQPKDPMLHCNLAKAWAGQGCLDRAIASFDKSLRLDKAHADAVSGKADLLERRGDYDKARNLLAPLVAAGNEVASSSSVPADRTTRSRWSSATLTNPIWDPALAGSCYSFWRKRSRQPVNSTGPSKRIPRATASMPAPSTLTPTPKR